MNLGMFEPLGETVARRASRVGQVRSGAWIAIGRCARLIFLFLPIFGCGELNQVDRPAAPASLVMSPSERSGAADQPGNSSQLARSGAADQPGGPNQPSRDNPADRRSALQAASRWLWNQQADDGGWHSATYGLLKSGQALTPFVLFALLEADAPVAPPPNAGVAKGLSYLASHMSEQGALGMADPDLFEYPNYATAYALLCLSHPAVVESMEADKLRTAVQDRQDLVRRMQEYLIEQQFSEHCGFGPETVVFGGWGFGGPLPEGTSPGHMDIHHTRVVLEALRRAGADAAEAFERAEEFLKLMQRHRSLLESRPAERQTVSFAAWDAPYDGGFYFSPVVLAANKGGEAGQGTARYFRSYATATCDGLLALLACGVSPQDERVVAARRWLDDHPRLDRPSGVPADATEDWGQSLRLTHYALRAQVMARMGASAEEREELAQWICHDQRPDGSYCNSAGFLMKEDDPMIATALAVIALGALERAEHTASASDPGRSVPIYME